MPIRSRDFTANPVQEPATRQHVPSKDAVLNKVEHPKQAAFFLYGGENPMDVPTDDLTTMVRTVDNQANVDKVYRNRIRSKATAARAFCVMCNGGQPKAVRLCSDVTCALWPYRMGNNPFKRK